MMNKQQFEEMLPAYAIHALDEDEQQQFEQAMAVQPEYQTMLTGYYEMLAGLASLAPAVEPPSGHRERMLARLEQAEAGAALPTKLATSAMLAQPRRPEPTASVSPANMIRNRSNLFNFVAMAASIVLIIGLFAWNFNLQNQLSQAQVASNDLRAQVNTVNSNLKQTASDRDAAKQTAAQLQTQLDASKNSVADLQGKLAQANSSNQALQQQLNQTVASVSQLQTASDLLGQRGSVVKELPGTDNQQNAVSHLIVNKDKGILLTYNLPVLPENKTYEFWVIDQNSVQYPAGTFNVDQKGNAIVNLSSPGPFNKYAVAGVTIEPAGGSPKPTGTMVTAGGLGGLNY